MVSVRSKHVQDLVWEIVDWAFKLSPTTATGQGYPRYNDISGRFTESEVAVAVNEARTYDRKLTDLVQCQSLHEGDRTDLVVCRAYVRNVICELDLIKLWRRDPSVHIEAFVFGCYALTMAFNLEAGHRFECLCSRLASVPDLLEDARTSLSAPCRPMVQAALDTLPRVEHLFSVIGSDLARSDDDRQRLSSLRREAVSAINEFAVWLREQLLPRAVDRVSIGREQYEFMITDIHLLPYSGEDLLVFGEKMVDKLQSRMKAVAREIDAEADWKQILAAADRGMPSGDLLGLYEQNVADLVRFCRVNNLVTLPEGDQLLIQETPSFVRTFIPYAAYLPCGMFSEQELPGRFFVTCPEPELPTEQKQRLLSAHNDCSRVLTSLHEAYPGHHLQLTIARKQEFVARKLSQSSTFVEGWAFYCEQMMVEQKFVTEPLQILTMLQGELWRAARVVIDASYHCRDMTVEMGQKYLQDNVGLQPEHALAEARWYGRRPSYPMTYMMGKQELLKLREQFTAGGHSLCEFHDRLLATAGLPPALAAKEIL